MEEPLTNEPESARAIEAAARVAVLQTAAEWTAALRARQAGDDPAEDQPAPGAAAHLRAERADLGVLLMRLAASLAAPEGEPAVAAALRHFDRLLVLRRARRLLHTAHQRLLSLYPAADPAVIEAVRALEADAARLAGLGPDAWAEAAPPFVAAGLRFVAGGA